jgi:hypothetical protein
MIKWEDISFPSHWVFDVPKTPKQHAITSSHIQESNSSTIIYFPPSHSLSSRFPCTHPSLQLLARSFGDSSLSVKWKDYSHLVLLQILTTKHGDYLVNFHLDTSVKHHVRCLHDPIFTLSSLSIPIQCPQFHVFVSNQPNVCNSEHENHNPRTNFPPPSTSKDLCPHPNCTDI